MQVFSIRNEEKAHLYDRNTSGSAKEGLPCKHPREKIMTSSKYIVKVMH
jgi:hypothetical protein